MDELGYRTYRVQQLVIYPGGLGERTAPDQVTQDHLLSALQETLDDYEAVLGRVIWDEHNIEGYACWFVHPDDVGRVRWWLNWPEWNPARDREFRLPVAPDLSPRTARLWYSDD